MPPVSANHDHALKVKTAVRVIILHANIACLSRVTERGGHEVKMSDRRHLTFVKSAEVRGER